MSAYAAPSPQQMRRALEGVCTGALRINEPLAPHTSWRVGGPADVWAEPADRDEAIALIGLARARGWPLTVLGSGSNVLVADKGVRGIVLNLTPGLSSVRITDTHATAEAGITLFRLAKQLAKAGLTGAEFFIGIPGTLGGALAGNAGAFGGEVGPLTDSVELYAFRRNAVVLWPRSRLRFDYRKSNLAGKGIILSATLRLGVGTAAAVEGRLRELTDERLQKQPVEMGSAGSVFKNPADGFAGQYIEQAGLKGTQVGGVMVSMKHANFMVNRGDATAADVRTLIRKVKSIVKRRCGVTLQEEVRYVGEWS